MMMMQYKPGPQACFLIDKMMASEWSIQEMLSKMTLHLEAIEHKVNSIAADLGKVRENVGLTITSLSLVQEEHAQTAKKIHTISATSRVPAGDGIIGAALAMTSNYIISFLMENIFKWMHFHSISRIID
jgi:hypothetical protein